MTFSRQSPSTQLADTSAPGRLITISSKADGRQVQTFAHPDSMPCDVQRLFDEAERINVSFGLTWYRTLIDAVFPNEDGVCFFVLRIDGEPVAVVPTVKRDGASGRETAALANYYTALYAPVCKPGLRDADLALLISAIRTARPTSSAMMFSPMDPDGESYRLLASAIRLAGLRPFRFFCFGNWYLSCADASWPDYLVTRSSDVRNTLKRKGKKLAADGGTFEIVSAGHRAEAGIAAFEQVYAASWKRPEPYPRFMPDLIETCRRQGWLRLGVVWLKDRPIAAQLWIVAHGRAEIYKLAYDDAFKQYSAGSLLTAHLMQHVFEQDKVTEVDYLIGDDPYKAAWMSHRRERWGLIAYDPRTAAGLLGMVRELVGRTAKPWLARLRARHRSSHDGQG